MDNPDPLPSINSPSTESITSINTSTPATSTGATNSSLNQTPLFTTFSSKLSTIIIPPSPNVFGQSSNLVVLRNPTESKRLATESSGDPLEPRDAHHFFRRMRPSSSLPTKKELPISSSSEMQTSPFSNIHISFPPPPPPKPMPITRSPCSRVLSFFHGLLCGRKGREDRERKKTAHQPQEPTLKPHSPSLIQPPPPTATQQAKLASRSSRHLEGTNTIRGRSIYRATSLSLPQENGFSFPTAQLNAEEPADFHAEIKEWRQRKKDKELRMKGFEYKIKMPDGDIQRKILRTIEEVEEDDTCPNVLKPQRELTVFASVLSNEDSSEGEGEEFECEIGKFEQRVRERMRGVNLKGFSTSTVTAK